MSSKNSKNSIMCCSSEQLERFLGKICIWNISFMERPLTGRLLEVNSDYFLIEMRDGRTLCASIDCLLGFGMAKNQPKSTAEAV